MFNQYVLILVWIGLMALLQGSFYREEYNELIGEYDWRIKPIFAFVVMAPVIWMAATRESFLDTNAYVAAFFNMPDSWSEIPGYIMTNIKKDRGFYALTAAIRVCIGDSRFGYLGILALMQGLVVSRFYRKYSRDYVFPMFLFIASTDYLSWMFNGVRQFTAVILIIASTGLMIKKKYIPLIGIIILASFFHQSALIMLPIVVIAQGKAWNYKTLLYILAVLVSIAFVGRFTSFLDDALVSTQYENVVSDYTSWNDTGTHILRILLYSIPAIISFIYRKKVQLIDDPIVDLCTNMSIVSMGLYVLSGFTSGIFIGRLPIFVSLYAYILLSWEIDNVISERLRQSAKIIIVVVYLLFYYYQNHFIWGIM